MISALQKISGNSVVASAPSEVREMFIENPHSDFAGMFATHPPIEKRIEALAKFAGGRVAPPVAAPAAPAGKAGPWG
jgi:heat shock protein HtpX